MINNHDSDGVRTSEGEGVRAVRRAVACLRLLSSRPRLLTITEIARELGLALSTTHRLLATLQAEGLVEQDTRSHRYRIGGGMIQFATQPLIDQEHMCRIARPLLEALRETSSETVHLAVLRGIEVVTIEQIESTHSLLVRHARGMVIPAHATALGKVLLAYHPYVAEAVLAGGLPRLTSETVTDPARLRDELQEIREIGYSINRGQRNIDTAGVAAPVFGESAMPAAALGISGPATRLPTDVLAHLALEARRSADMLSSMLRARNPVSGSV